MATDCLPATRLLQCIGESKDEMCRITLIDGFNIIFGAILVYDNLTIFYRWEQDDHVFSFADRTVEINNL